MNNDVRDAAWILVHVARDVSDHATFQFTDEEKAKLFDAAQLYCAVVRRHAEEPS